MILINCSVLILALACTVESARRHEQWANGLKARADFILADMKNPTSLPPAQLNSPEAIGAMTILAELSNQLGSGKASSGDNVQDEKRLVTACETLSVIGYEVFYGQCTGKLRFLHTTRCCIPKNFQGKVMGANTSSKRINKNDHELKPHYEYRAY
ncbi:uncharacterized protein LOC141855558 [Brevipalpus obovatus]|uniref:uncharacterized protein LOC141855558 n=1 Tax=Brevipalpus obovatus TaxID=246614 RepID=UPI003D9E7DA7